MEEIRRGYSSSDTLVRIVREREGINSHLTHLLRSANIMYGLFGKDVNVNVW